MYSILESITYIQYQNWILNIHVEHAGQVTEEPNSPRAREGSTRGVWVGDGRAVFMNSWHVDCNVRKDTAGESSRNEASV